MISLNMTTVRYYVYVMPEQKSSKHLFHAPSSGLGGRGRGRRATPLEVLHVGHEDLLPHALAERLEVEVALVPAQDLDDLGHVAGGLVPGEGEALVGDLLALDEQLLEGELGRGGLVLEELVELLLALAVRAGVLGVARVVLDELLDLFEA